MNINDTATGAAIFHPPQHHFITPQNQNPPQHIKKKRNQPGNPDPEAEVIALSPKTLVATSRFFCEICNKGFQRDQNLQLHRRGHNLPWKLKKRENKEVVMRKKVYVCPESSCVHHDPSRALGDLTGIKKHFSRKHGEKKWKCEKCSKRYAVQSDCKAHSKICGTREYKCECGTIFSRRDSFITHRAFCDTLAVESSRSAITGNPTIFPSQLMNHLHFQQPQTYQLPAAAIFSMKKEQPSSDHFRNIEIPPWLIMNNCQPFAGPSPPASNNFTSSSIFPDTTRLDQQYYTQTQKDLNLHENPKPNLRAGSGYNATGESAEPCPQYISATALVRKAGQLGATISNKASAVSAGYSQSRGPAMLMRQVLAHNTHVSDSATKQTDEVLLTTSTGPANIISGGTGMMNTTSFSNYANANIGFEDAILYGGFNNLNPKNKDDDEQLYFNAALNEEDMTKDFLGLRPLSHSDDIFNIAGLVNTTTDHQFKNHKTWQS
ncbi:hypothetical protein HAX54_047357 [Datura stramonium]|uniref:C2H2-type domain-containing protein n=1 Tax=Datura stramonium TaxID=4076 RepID=A0ABS8SSA0_DATST|nr:hypothetical protein [Datura stramonium]